MKKKQLAYGFFFVSFLMASVAHAGEYPASNFQPKVIYSSEAATPAPAAASPCAPAAKAEQTEVDSKYPAAYFHPKVIYSSDAKGS